MVKNKYALAAAVMGSLSTVGVMYLKQKTLNQIKSYGTVNPPGVIEQTVENACSQHSIKSNNNGTIVHQNIKNITAKDDILITNISSTVKEKAPCLKV